MKAFVIVSSLVGLGLIGWFVFKGKKAQYNTNFLGQVGSNIKLPDITINKVNEGHYFVLGTHGQAIQNP
jgi:hypothetical protein